MVVRRYYAESAFEQEADSYEVTYDELTENNGTILSKTGTETLSGKDLSSLLLWNLRQPTGKLSATGRKSWKTVDSVYAKSYADAKEIVKFFYPEQEIQMARARSGHVFRLG